MEEFYTRVIQELKDVKVKVDNIFTSPEKWEYHDETFKRDSGVPYISWLNVKGEEGWECVAISGLKHLFKRRRK